MCPSASATRVPSSSSFGDGEVGRIEVTHGEVADRGALRLERADLSRDAQDLGSNDTAGEGREAAVGLVDGAGRGGRCPCRGCSPSTTMRILAERRSRPRSAASCVSGAAQFFRSRASASSSSASSRCPIRLRFPQREELAPEVGRRLRSATPPLTITPAIASFAARTILCTMAQRRAALSSEQHLVTPAAIQRTTRRRAPAPAPTNVPTS